MSEQFREEWEALTTEQKYERFPSLTEEEKRRVMRLCIMRGNSESYMSMVRHAALRANR